MRDLHINFEGENIKVKAQKVKGKLWFHLDGQTYCYDDFVKTKKRGLSGAVGDGSILAPMPGKILKVHKQVGDKVEAGETVIALEAMKMEYSLSVEFAGMVESISCNEGDQVTLEQILAQVSKEN